MKHGIVFIGWTSDQSLATKVSEELKKKGFLGIVGGSAKNNSKLFAQEGAIYNTVTSQMDHCNQAILLYKKRTFGTNDEHEEVSDSLIFETGYLCSKFGRKEISKKVMLYGIGMKPEDTKRLFPGDLEGILSEFISDEQSEDEIAKAIVDKFVEVQDHQDSVFAMDILNSPRDIEREMERHFISPNYTDHQLAISLVYYTQSQYFYQTISNGKRRIGEFIKKIHSFHHNTGCMTNELINIANLAAISLDLFGEISIVDMDYVSSLNRKTFKNYLNRYSCAVHQVYYDTDSVSSGGEHEPLNRAYYSFDFEEVTEENLFKILALSQALQHTTFLYALHIAYLTSSLSEDDKRTAKVSENRIQKEIASVAQEAVKYGEQVLKYYDQIIDSNVYDTEKVGFESLNCFYITFMRAFTHTNLRDFYGFLGNTELQEYHNELFYRHIDMIYCFAFGKYREIMSESLFDYITLEYFKAKRAKTRQRGGLRSDEKEIEAEIAQYIKERQSASKYEQVLLKQMKSEEFIRKEAVDALIRAFKGEDPEKFDKALEKARKKLGSKVK